MLPSSCLQLAYTHTQFTLQNIFIIINMQTFVGIVAFIVVVITIQFNSIIIIIIPLYIATINIIKNYIPHGFQAVSHRALNTDIQLRFERRPCGIRDARCCPGIGLSIEYLRSLLSVSFHQCSSIPIHSSSTNPTLS
jgi:hypothetical protein